MSRIKKPKELWGVDVRTSKKAKRIGLSLGAVGTVMGGASAIGLPSWVGITGFVLMTIGAFVANMFTDDPQ